jgi:thiol-disulfide isomerase/thioredoxin
MELSSANQRAKMQADQADQPKPPAQKTALVTALGVAGLAAVAGFASVYVTLGRPDNGPSVAASAPAVESARRSAAPTGPGSNALSQGQMAAFVFRAARADLPEIKFEDATGKARTLADWKGKIVLLNLWATWCLPCRKEMPALDRLQQELGSDAFEVVALSVDRAGRSGARKFLDEAKVGKLALSAAPPRACRRPCSSTGRVARSVACWAPPNGTVRTRAASSAGPSRVDGRGSRGADARRCRVAGGIDQAR